MEVIATQKFLWMSPKKIRPLADLAKKMKPLEAVEKLPFTDRRSAEPLVKVITSAIANARNKGIADKDLGFKEIQISEGPRFKRGQPVSRGQWHPIIKRTSHIRVVLTTLPKPVVKDQKDKDPKEPKKEITSKKAKTAENKEKQIKVTNEKSIKKGVSKK